jgi:hypothetical protein
LLVVINQTSVPLRDCKPALNESLLYNGKFVPKTLFCAIQHTGAEI